MNGVFQGRKKGDFVGDPPPRQMPPPEQTTRPKTRRFPSSARGRGGRDTGALSAFLSLSTRREARPPAAVVSSSFSPPPPTRCGPSSPLPLSLSLSGAAGRGDARR